MNLRKGLEWLLEKSNTNKIIIKLADRSIIVVMTPKDYWNTCYTAFFINLDSNDPSSFVQDGVNKFPEKHINLNK